MHQASPTPSQKPDHMPQTRALRARWSKDWQADCLHPRDMRRMRDDMAAILAHARMKNGVADIGHLTDAGYSDAVAMDVGVEVAVENAVKAAGVAVAASAGNRDMIHGRFPQRAFEDRAR